MNKSLTDYATALSGSDFRILETLINDKYLKFKKFFELLKPFTDDIKSLEYVMNDEKEVLHTKITFKKKVDLDTKKELISDWKKAGYGVDYKIDGKTVELKIKYKE